MKRDVTWALEPHTTYHLTLGAECYSAPAATAIRAALGRYAAPPAWAQSGGLR